MKTLELHLQNPKVVLSIKIVFYTLIIISGILIINEAFTNPQSTTFYGY